MIALQTGLYFRPWKPTGFSPHPLVRPRELFTDPPTFPKSPVLKNGFVGCRNKKSISLRGSDSDFPRQIRLCRINSIVARFFHFQLISGRYFYHPPNAKNRRVKLPQHRAGFLVAAGVPVPEVVLSVIEESFLTLPNLGARRNLKT